MRKKITMNVALLLAGGSGSRLGAKIPKQYIEVEGRTIISYCLETLLRHPMIDGIWIVAEEHWRDLIVGDIKCLAMQEKLRQESLQQEGLQKKGLQRDGMYGDMGFRGEKICGFSNPGQTRQLSIWNGLQDLKEWLGENKEKRKDMDLGRSHSGKVTVLVHDAARPLVSAETISACIAGCEEYDGVMPALPVKDTVYIGADGRIESLLDRSKVIAGQAPEAFRFEEYYEANQRLMPDEILKINGSTEPAILAGMNIKYIPGDERNFKVTTMTDLERFQEILRRNHSE